MIARGADGKVIAGDEYDQAKAIFAKIRHLLEAAGGAMADVGQGGDFCDRHYAARRYGARAPGGFSVAIFRKGTLVEVAAGARNRASRWRSVAIAHLGAGKR